MDLGILEPEVRGMKLKRKDKVMVLVGRDKGKTGPVIRVMPHDDLVIVEGVNLVKRHTKPSNKHPQGGILELTKPVATSKVALVCPNCRKPTRIGYQLSGNNKERICRKCKAVIK
ncbi:MAG TPA: 50S ribosomal protein L24 [Candidatus Saccharimonadales bacterium]|nr:50S ribosomal protein L24 [Candidatus Saccharimonadales bacterium]